MEHRQVRPQRFHFLLRQHDGHRDFRRHLARRSGHAREPGRSGGAPGTLAFGTSPQPAVIPGDVNRDQTVDARDLRLLVAEIYDGDGASADSCAGGLVASGAEADVNADHVIAAADIAGVARFR